MRVWVVLGTGYPVVRKTFDDDASQEGEFDPKAGEIRIAAWMPIRRLWEVESHEVFHCCESAMDVERRLSELGLSDEMVEKVRELYAGTVVPVFVDTLERNGFLSRPAGEE